MAGQPERDGLDITCQNVCGKQLTNATCTAFSGCRWALDGVCTTGGDVGGPATIWIGVVLSLVADVIVNIGMNAMKHAHNINTAEDGTPLRSFLTIPWWWVGVLGIVGGEVKLVAACTCTCMHDADRAEVCLSHFSLCNSLPRRWATW